MHLVRIHHTSASCPFLNRNTNTPSFRTVTLSITANHNLLVLQELRHREFRQFLLDIEFHLYISFVIGFEGFPFLRGVARKVSCPTAVGFCGSARFAEKFDEVFAFGCFLLIELQNGTDSLEGQIKRYTHKANLYP